MKMHLLVGIKWSCKEKKKTKRKRKKFRRNYKQTKTTSFFALKVG